jgi:hypothetical protein
MNFVSIFSEKSVIAGIEVNDTSLRLVSLAPGKNPKDQARILTAAEVELPAGIIVGSTVQDEPALTAAIKNLVRTSRFSGSFAIASIPIAEVYSKIFSFPNTISGSKLDDAMMLNFEYQSPITKADGYADWETLEHAEGNDVMFLASPKTVTDGYVHAFQNAGLKLVALEVHPQSLSRSLVSKPADALLYTTISDTSASICVLQYNALRFCRSLTQAPYDKKRIAEEERRVRDYFETGKMKLKAAVSLASAPLVQPFAADSRIKNNPGTFVIALGAAMRGLLPRSQDAHVSLLPVGTEEAYSYQRADVVSEFITHVTLALSIFFCVVFLGAWGYSVRLQSMVDTQLKGALSLTPPIDATNLETKAIAFNNLASTAASLLRTEPKWNPVLTEIRLRTPTGVIVQSLSLPAPEQNFSMSGFASNRAALVELRKGFQESSLFTEVNLPLTNLELKERIPFTLAFKLRDPSSVYPK